MTIRKKTLSIVGGVVSALVIVLVVTSYMLVSGRFARLEVKNIHTQVQRVENELITILSRLESTVGDWAPWDDSYQFVEDRNRDYIENNLVDSTFENLRLNFMLFYDKEGRMVFSKFFQLSPLQSYVRPAPIQTAVDLYPELLTHQDTKSRQSGILITPTVPYLFASRPIVTSNFEGPIRGTLIMGRALDALEADQISTSTKIKANFKILPKAAVDSEIAENPLTLYDPNKIYVNPVTADRIIGSTRISDLSGRPALLLEIESDRDIYRYGLSTWRLNALVLIGFGLGLISLLMFLLNRIVLNPLARLTEKVKKVPHSMNRFERLEVTTTDEIGQLIESINSMLTVNQNYHAEKADNEHYLRELLDSINCGVMVVDAKDHRILDINRAGVLLYQGDREELIGNLCHKLVCPKEIGNCPITDQGKTIDHTECTLLKSDGSELPILKSVTKVHRRGRTYLIESFIDISNLKKVEADLRESEERYRQFFEDDITGDFLLSVDGRIIDCNPALTGMLGYDHPEEIRNATIETHYPSQKDRRELFQRICRERCLERVELELNHREGRPLYCIGNLIGQFSDAETLQAVRGYLFDDTKRIHLEKDLRRAQKMEAIGTLAGGIAHDFNNILAGIMGYTEIAIAELPESSSTIGRLQMVMKSATRARDLVHQILTFSRQSEDDSHPLFLKPIVREVVKMMRASLPTTIEIHENFSSEAKIMANPVQIHQLIMNLCTNAAYAMKKEGGCLSIEAKDTQLDQAFSSRYPGVRPGPFVCLSVKDTGIGISPGIMDRIFDPFFSTKNKNEGTGLGLSVVHGIVSKLKGAIEVDSSSSGSTFNIYLPIIEKKATTVPAKSPHPLPTGSETIVFVDDEDILVEIGVHLLGVLGYRTHAFTNSRQALEFILANGAQVDLIITDMTMPGMTGLALANRLQETLPDLPIIICTGYSEEISAETASSMGIKGFVMKPMVIKDLAAKVREVLDSDT